MNDTPDNTGARGDAADDSGSAVGHIIRTYAKDLAAMSGKEPPQVNTAPPEPEKPPQSIEAPAEKEVPQTKATEPQVIEETVMPPVAPKPEEAIPEPEAVSAAGAPSRESILARLRAITERERGAESAAASAQAPAEEEPASFAEPEKIETPTLPPLSKNNAPKPAPIPPAWVPLPEPEPAAKSEASEGPERIHTYKSDFTDRVGETGGSAFSVLAAEQNASGTLEAQPAKKGGLLRIALAVCGVALLAGGGTLVYFAFVKSITPVTVTVAPAAPSLIFVDERVQLTGSGRTLLAALAASAATPLDAGKVRLTYVMEEVPGALGTTTVPAPGGVLFNLLGLPAPGLLLRNVDASSTVGIVHAGSETRAFFILHTSSYERTFAGMLAWEGTLPQDLALLYPPYPQNNAGALSVPASATSSAATTTAATSTLKSKSLAKATSTTTPPVVTAPFVPAFKDELIGNNDVRALKDAAGRTLVLYGYRDQSTLIIARDEAAFTELVNRLSATKTQ